jgi:signal transduction histidine kinase
VFGISVGEQHRVERLLAVARIFLAFGVLLLAGLEWFVQARPLSSQYAFGISLYGTYSVLVFLLLAAGERPAAFRLIVHLSDLCWPVVLAALATRSDNAFWVLSFFAINAAAFRWGAWQTLATTAFALLLSMGDAIVHLGTVRGAWSPGPIDPRELVLRAAYLLLVGVPVAYLAARARQRRADREAIAHLARIPSLKLGMARTVQEILDQLRSMFGAREVLIAVQEIPAGRAYLWQARADATTEPSARVRELDRADEQCYWFAARARCWDMVESRASGRRILSWDAQGRRRSPMPEPDMTRFLTGHPCERLIVVGFALEKEWTGRIFVLDPAPVRDRKGRLKFLEAAVRELSPVLYTTYVLRRVRSWSRELERARVARELHDGITQSLISAQMKLELARRGMTAASTQVLSELESVQRILRDEISGIRDFIHRLKTPDVTAAEVVNVMTECVEQFEQETGVATRLATFDVESILLSQRTCTELVRILREALANVRRHSGARHVFVWFGADGNQYVLIVEDDGCGIASEAQATDGAWQRCVQPSSIGESVRAIAGTLETYSALGRGLRLEITVPSAEAKATITPGKLAMAKAGLPARPRRGGVPGATVSRLMHG